MILLKVSDFLLSVFYILSTLLKVALVGAGAFFISTTLSTFLGVFILLVYVASEAFLQVGMIGEIVEEEEDEGEE